MMSFVEIWLRYIGNGLLDNARAIPRWLSGDMSGDCQVSCSLFALFSEARHD